MTSYHLSDLYLPVSISTEAGSRHFDQFLDLLGQRIRLRHWDKYRGGLDVKGEYLIPFVFLFIALIIHLTYLCGLLRFFVGCFVFLVVIVAATIYVLLFFVMLLVVLIEEV